MLSVIVLALVATQAQAFAPAAAVVDDVASNTPRFSALDKDGEHFIDLSGFFGSWIGYPDISIMGPFLPTQTIEFTITPWSEKHGMLTADLFGGEPKMVPNSVQQFWFDQEGGMMTYCGSLTNFFSSSEPWLGEVVAPFVFVRNESSSTKLIFCGAVNGTAQCDIAQKRVQLLDDDKLEVTFHFPHSKGANATHAHLILRRQSDRPRFTVADFPSPCNLTQEEQNGGVNPLWQNSLDLVHHINHWSNTSIEEIKAMRSAKASTSASRCPHAHLWKNGLPASHPRASGLHATDQSSPSATAPIKRIGLSGRNYKHCYQLNDLLQYQLEFTLDVDNNMLHGAISANASDLAWVGLGFYPQQPLMAGADIVLGFTTPAAKACVHSLYAYLPVGHPVPNFNMSLSDTSVTRANGVLTVAFSRRLDSGHTAIPTSDPEDIHVSQLMWAAAPGKQPSTCEDFQSHGPRNRGFRPINWAHPEASMPNWLRCG